MKAIELTIEESLLADIDNAICDLSMTRDDFVRTALKELYASVRLLLSRDSMQRATYASQWLQTNLTSGKTSRFGVCDAAG